MARSPEGVKSPKGVKDPKTPKIKTPLEDLLLAQIQEARLPMPEREVKIVPGRNFRWDLAWPAKELAVECQGAIWITGGHSTGMGITRDCEKSILAQLEGWRAFSVTKEQIKSGKALKWIEKALSQY